MSKSESSSAQPTTLALIVALVAGVAVSVTYAATAGSAIALPAMIIADVVVLGIVLTTLLYVRRRRSRS